MEKYPPLPDLGACELLMSLFRSVPRVMVCVKDNHGRYISANEAFASRTRAKTVRAVVGKRAADLFPDHLAASYEAQDQSVLATGIPVSNQLEIITRADTAEGWFLTTKQLTTNGDGEPVVVVVSVPADLGRRGSRSGDGLRAVVEWVRAHHDTPVTSTELADVAGLSVDQLERSMQRTFGVSPKQFVVRHRVDMAATMLATSNRALAEIAHMCGYYDQAQFTRQFSKAIGITPGAYRSLVADH